MPGENRLRAGWRVLAHFVIFAALLILTTVPVAIFLNAVRLPGSIAFLLEQTPMLVGMTLSVWLARRFIDRRPFAGLGLNRPQAVMDCAAGFIIAGIIMGGIYVAEWAAGWLRFEAFAWSSISPIQVFGELAVWAIIFAIVGWQEELLSRGYWLVNMTEGSNLTIGVLLSSILFGLLHSLNPDVTPMAITLLCVAGVFLAYGYIETRQLWLGIGLHLGWNYFEGTIFGFQVSGLDTFRLIRASVQGPELITGGAFGPEAGLIVLPAMLVGVALMYVYVRQVRAKRAASR